MSQKLVSEIFDEFRQATTAKDRENILKFNATEDLKLVLHLTYAKSVKFGLSELPYYKPDNVPVDMGYLRLGYVLGKMYLFRPEMNGGLSQETMEKILIQYLEGLASPEAIVYGNIILRDQKIPGLTKKLIEKVFPGLLD